MEGNLLLEQFSRYKKMELEASPFHFLLDANIELNPHQINAFCAAIQALKTGGIVLADEVGLGKTIEAGLVLKYVLETGAKRVLIALPASLRKQWELELDDKFGLESIILDRLTVEKEASEWHKRLDDNKKVRIVLTSYDYSSKLMKRFPDVKWDFIIIDEAHNLRNVFHGTKRAKNLYELSKGIPKILLTATPLQNSLTDLHGLISFIDPRIFGSEKVFNSQYIEGQDYADLKRELSPVLYRTLRKDVAKYMNFKKRTCKTVDFALSQDEIELYQRVNDFLKRDLLLFNVAKLFGYDELADQFDLNNISALYSEVCNRIALINQKKLLEEAQDMSAILNLAMDEIEFHFRKVSEKELVIADKYQDTLNRTRKAVLHTLDPKDPEYITLLEELQRLLAKKNIEELTADEMTADIEALERIRKLAEQKNLADQMLAAKYDGDVKFMRTHKRLRETPPPIAGDVALHQVLTHLKHRVDSQVLSNSHLMDNEPYFMQGMFPMIKQELDAQHLKYSAAQIKYIGTCISNEYFTERNFAS